ncbi:penicillin-binding protein 1C [Leptolyngbya sp. 'hensonii']|uniref:penicillin-binding protein 1C n=1 Tax=Leptolyngbya sp. 'hensonii' TaxID=1922337 RepID=UPI00094F6C85|nr:penicillin-binding protein 1C [Leptolyngbya sp. 'hensonii']OLP15636.1 penicillin-binding protein 1C [Leptolyngbya sp. 'hensonii']
MWRLQGVRSSFLRRYRPIVQGLLAIVLICLTVRLLPYLAPVRAADLNQDEQAIEVTDRHGLPLGTLLTRDQDHTAVVPLNQVSPSFLQAILAAEDGRFYRHGPLEMRAIGRSVLEAIRAGRFRSGASTITMQLAKMVDPVPTTLWGKAQEIWFSWRIAAGMSKDEILQAYINRLPMGGNIYGVEAAARTYFGIPASDLTVAQATLLAALPNDPVYLHPYDHWERLKERQAYVLDRMVKDGYLTPAQARVAKAEPVSLQSRQQGIIAAPHFLFWLASQLPVDHPARIQTTIDRSLQQFVETQVEQVLQTLAPHNVHQAAALVMDNHNGDVLAYVGSPDYFDTAAGGRNDGVQALRQPGSALKPFLYELALEKQVIRPNTVLADVPTRYAIPGARLYSPTDYSERFLGPVRVRVALANSLNVPAVRVLEKTGVGTFLTRLHELGFTHLNQSPDYYGLGLALGSGEVSLWELAQAYVTIANQGQRVRPSLVTASLSFEPKTLQRTSDKGPMTIGSSVVWALITDILRDSHARARAFGVNSVLNLPFSAAVKTGTSSDFRDTWTVGFTRDYTVATWVGNFNGEPMRQVSGVTGAAPLWNRILLHLHEQQEPTAFPPPAGMIERPVCALSGMKPTPACPAVVQEYFFPEDLAAYERQPDTFYQAVVSPGQGLPYRLNLPSEYNEWLALQQPHLAQGNLRIVAPRNGDYFVIDAAAMQNSDSPQQLEFKLASMPSQPVEWWLNGEKLATRSTSSLFWSPRPGNWTLEVRSSSGVDSVQFQIQIAAARTYRRGFSVAPPSR